MEPVTKSVRNDFPRRTHYNGLLLLPVLQRELLKSQTRLRSWSILHHCPHDNDCPWQQFCFYLRVPLSNSYGAITVTARVQLSTITLWEFCVEENSWKFFTWVLSTVWYSCEGSQPIIIVHGYCMCMVRLWDCLVSIIVDSWYMTWHYIILKQIKDWLYNYH